MLFSAKGIGERRGKNQDEGRFHSFSVAPSVMVGAKTILTYFIHLEETLIPNIVIISYQKL